MRFRRLLCLFDLKGGVAFYRQLACVRTVKRLGGIVGYRNEYPKTEKEILRRFKGKWRWIWRFYDSLRISEINSVLFSDLKLMKRDLLCLARLPMLETLAIADCAIEETVVNDIATIPSLKYLQLSSADVEDTWLPALAELIQLDVLVLVRTRMTRYGIERLKSALPNCDVVFRDDNDM